MKNKIYVIRFISLIAGFYFSIHSAKAVLTPIVDSIPMSDGRKLAADIYIPKGMTSGPVILIQTPYNRQASRLTGLPMGIGTKVDSSKFIFVVTDWRGFYGSKKAAYIGSPDRGTDGYSTVEWIANQSWSNGKVGTWGPSALGKVQYQTAQKRPPHLVCICPLVAGPQFEYQEYFPNGVLRTEYVEQLDQLGFGLTASLMAHPYYDATWTYAETLNHYTDSLQVPVLMIGGWYDHNVELMLDCFKGMINGPSSNVKDKHKLVMGPWVHGGHGAAKVGTSLQGQLSYPNAEDVNDSMALKFFDFYLRQVSNSWNSLPVVTYYQMGENKWLSSNTWPPTGISNTDYYMNKSGLLSKVSPSSNNDTLCFTYDPTKPSPTIGGCTLRNDLDQGPYDQSVSVENKGDILVFTSDVLTSPLTIKGNVVVNLKVSSDQLDTDFDVRLTDVYPDGKSMLLNDACFRMRFRNGFTKALEAMMTPGTVYNCNIELPATCITFAVGHRFRIDISSSNYPKYNRNMNNGANMYPGNSTDSLLNPNTAFNTVYVNSVNASKVVLPITPNTDISDIISLDRVMGLYPNPSNDRVFVWNSVAE
ncbi:MAG TPA: CocE/NonD family hydrolase, partial [Bacteroidia bacterium]